MSLCARAPTSIPPRPSRPKLSTGVVAFNRAKPNDVNVRDILSNVCLVSSLERNTNCEDRNTQVGELDCGVRLVHPNL
jgi:hypothetical protein